MIYSDRDREIPHVPGHTVMPFVALAVLFLLVLFGSLPLTAQDDTPEHSEERARFSPDRPWWYWRLGAAVEFGLSSHNVVLDIYDNGAGCGQFVDQVTGYDGLRLFFETPFLRAIPVSLIAGASFQDRSISFVQTFRTLSRYPDGSFDEVVTQQHLDAPLTGIGPFLGLQWEPIGNIRIGGAPSLLFMTSGDIEQREEITSPLGAVFTETGTFQRPVDRGGDLAFASTVVGFSMWLNGVMPIGSHVELIPELGGNFLLTSLQESSSWTSSSFYFSLGLAWKQGPSEPSLPPPPIVDVTPPTPPVIPDNLADTPQSPDPVVSAETEPEENNAKSAEAPAFWVNINAVGIDQEGNEYPEPIIEITEAPWVQSIPLIPYIFFDEGDARIPNRYALLDEPSDIEHFDTDSLVSQTPISLHYQLLNILGQRLHDRPEVVVTIVGTTSGDEGVSENERERLGLARAQSVRSYLVDTWEISPERINVAAGSATNPSKEETVEGREENRRAEFLFDGESLTQPVVVERVARVASPPAVKFYPELYTPDTASVNVADWNITVRQGAKELLRLDGARNDSMTVQQQYWSLGDMRINRDLTPVVYQLEVTDDRGRVATALDSFTVQERKTTLPTTGPEGNLSITEYLLAGFNYNSAELTRQHIAEIYEVARMAAEGMWIEVTGYTDKVGDAARNRELAMERAQRVVDTLLTIRRRLALPAIPISQVRGQGESGESRFDNSRPEGRIFSRMVRVTVNRRTRQ